MNGNRFYIFFLGRRCFGWHWSHSPSVRLLFQGTLVEFNQSHPDKDIEAKGESFQGVVSSLFSRSRGMNEY